MIKIGLVGEDPNDTASIDNLISPYYKQKGVKFIPLLKNIRGYQLDSIDKVKRALKIEFEDKRCDFVIYIRDSDAPFSDSKKINARKEWFRNLDRSTNKMGIFLLNIYELEALILADINGFNKIYKTKIKYSKNPSFEKDPKRFLMQKTINSPRQYKESDCPEIFSKLNFLEIRKNCQFFNDFIESFQQKIN